MEFTSGYSGELYQENIDNVVTRWFDKDGNEVSLPENGEAGVSYRCKDSEPSVPSWYTPPLRG